MFEKFNKNASKNTTEQASEGSEKSAHSYLEASSSEITTRFNQASDRIKQLFQGGFDEKESFDIIQMTKLSTVMSAALGGYVYSMIELARAGSMSQQELGTPYMVGAGVSAMIGLIGPSLVAAFSKMKNNLQNKEK